MNKPALFLAILGTTVISFASAKTHNSTRLPHDFCLNLNVAVCNNADLECTSNIETACENAVREVGDPLGDHALAEKLYAKLVENISPLVCQKSKGALNQYEQANRLESASYHENTILEARHEANDCQYKFEGIVKKKMGVL